MWITQQFQTVLINLWFHFTWWDSRETYSWPANKGSSCFIICYSNQIKAATNPLAALEDEPFLMLLPGNQMKSLWDNRWDIIAFKDAIKSSIYWGNQWLWHTEDLIVWKKGHFWACSFYPLKDSPSLLLAVITAEIYTTKDDDLLLSSWIMTCRPSGNRSPGCLRYLPPFSTSSEYSINRRTPVVYVCTRTHDKQKITVGLGLCLFMPCQYRKGSHQESSLIRLPGSHGKPWEDWTHK